MTISNPQESLESTQPFSSSSHAARLAEYTGGQQDAGQNWESTQPFSSSSSLAARIAEYTGGQPPVQPEPDHPEDKDSTQLAQVSVSEQQDFFTAPEEFHPDPIEGSDSSVRDRAHGSQQGGEHQPAEVSLDQLALRWDPRIRVVFRQPRDLAIQIDQAGQQEVTMLSRPGSEEQPLWLNLLGCIQSRSEPMFSLTAGSIQCEFFYIPNCDDIILRNGPGPVEIQCVSDSEFSSKLLAKGYTTLVPGTWKVWTAQHSLEFQLWPRQYSVEIQEGRILGKRSSGEIMLPATKRRRAPEPLLLLMPSVTPSSLPEGEVACIAYSLDDQAWLAYKPSEGQTLMVRDENADEVGYRLAYLYSRWERRSHCAYTFKAILNSNLTSTKAVVVKIITQPQGIHAEECREAGIRSAALRWYAEFKQHRHLDHPRIAHLLGYDARLHTLYIEFKDLSDLSSSAWCTKTGLFRGNHADACRILADISSALLYLENKSILHNDIKPGNILYGRDTALCRRGAILIDFGLAQEPGSIVRGGTPWYVPPEYRVGRRGYPADIWALGISMLYLIKYIMLPEKQPQFPAWQLAQYHTDSRAEGQMDQWLEEVERLQCDLQARSSQKYREGVELEVYISKMLELSESQRITRRELAQQTRRWTSDICDS
ncbi:hypothetical protein M406DRAFT_107452 [Cryphonectria parasitica EP155]|uniref:Protein kinase domain-containing protein n=1 Tax=Cryphonectria parasitica (strain ATCC 38755 / EP155) TaxID=660469 RepID=A0A9P4Y8N9_CRYP1|nr:uncharacterized protein M406DRAFT_107452 [Cryphonectria parasitica EP155]KAF3768490.1 hypothetical protein M406DRAFT_107452 [Cryphonectria parasitica EP155]